ncbi:Uncharacterized protein OS=Pirellula staleyi (strain ATCC 27377 / DSM 6068 / ICPB 4128) GN=Psta_1862 PE=4 SV=1 [Gemmataceae bacterium]|nr:Uncharacterized protein OS=Pirellula staleyi (strain ATCC 27377 / DSM 6068 / ICPB 4128) GN=Psta_1862 PE=4 SV=1 [Gemmataceae bacterium]VTT96393.1 Uncharacterized protein OS=Pirellula staleyi (strain ATCC 27377 / DSM 6068 / ICPB 4128) GN=Psta_1862 PE=4 SV=1 [Gemmataceae bacterium]
MRRRPTALAVTAVVCLVAALAVVPALRAEQIHRLGFAGRNTALVRGDANVKVDENEHDVSTLSFKSQPSSEHLKLTLEAATGDAAFVHYYYDTPPAPVSDVLSAGVWVKSTKAGVQLRARVVFPKEPDPANPQAALTMLIVGKTSEKSRQWDKLTLDNVPDLVGKHLPVLQAKTGRAVNTTGAYIDRLVLNLYTGPGAVEVWVDDLDIGPVTAPAKPAAAAPGVTASITKNPRGETQGRGRQVEQRGGQIFVDGKPFLFRAIRHTGTPLHVLRQAGFDSLALPADSGVALIEEANREGWLVVPTVPLVPARTEDDGRVSADRDRGGDEFSPVMQKFAGTDVLFWDLGGGRTGEESERVFRTSDLIRRLDPRRPRGADVWDGFSGYSNFLDVVGAHRWPLFTNLDLVKYRDWLAQRKSLTADRATYWTWVQNHLPDWYVTQVMGQKPGDPFTEPIGPHPEQVRVMAYIALACGCRGIGFWSDRFLADSHHGRDRLQGMALLNAEIDMLSPVVLAARERTQWLDTNNPNVKAALMRGERGAVLLPIWFGPGTQFVPDQGASAALTVVVPLVHDGADPWRISPAGVECLSHQTTKVPGGTQLTIPEFDLVCPIVFTSDRPGLVAWWQDYTRKYGRLSAKWALDMAAVEYEKVAAVHAKLVALGVNVKAADTLFQQSTRFHEEARRQFAAELYDKAYQDAVRALRPLRVVMRDHWQQATATLDTPTASPYAVSYFSLPKHWELFKELQNTQPGANALPHGGFEFAGKVPSAGVRVDALPGWTARFGTLDRVNVAAGVVPSEKHVAKPDPKKPPVPVRGPFAPGREIVSPDTGYAAPVPELGQSLLRLDVRHRGEIAKDGKPAEVSQAPLERTFLAVESPPVRFPPGTLVRVSAWIKVPEEISGSADGALFYDDAGGEPLGVRLSVQPRWKQYHLYRRVPASGQIGVTLALTGVGTALFDEVKIEPMVPAPAAPGDDAKAAKAGYRGAFNEVAPAGGPPRR